MNTSSDFERFESALSSLYEAPLAPAAWAQFMEKLSRLIDARGGQYLLWDSVERRMGFSVMTDEYPEKAAEYYNTHLAPIDERRQLAEHAPAGVWVFDHEHFDHRFVDRSEAYRWLNQWDIRYSAAVRLAEGNSLLSMLGMFRAPNQAPFGAQERVWLDRLTPHVQRASQLHLRMESLRASASAGWQAANLLDYPVIVVDETTSIRFANLAAEHLFRLTGAPLTVKQGSLRGTTAASHEKLFAAVRRATNTVRGQASVVSLQRGIGTPSYQVVVLSASKDIHFHAPHDRPMAILTIGAPGQGRTVDAELLRQLFGLSDAESRVAAGLAQGSSLKQLADDACVSINTVRTQLQVVFAKTNTHRQSELVSLVSALPRMAR